MRFCANCTAATTLLITFWVAGSGEDGAARLLPVSPAARLSARLARRRSRARRHRPEGRPPRRARAGHPGSHHDHAKSRARALSKRSRPRCVSAKDRINFIDVDDEEGITLTPPAGIARIATSISARRRRACSASTAARRLSRVPRLRPHDRDRSQPRDSRSLRLDRARRGARFPRRRDGRVAEGSAPRLRARGDRRPRARSRNCRRPIRTWSSTARRRTASTRRMRTAAAGTACAGSSIGSRARPTKCTCACCSAATALTRPARLQRRPLPAGRAELPHRHAAAVGDKRQVARNGADAAGARCNAGLPHARSARERSRFRLTTPPRRCCAAKSSRG